MILIGRGHTKIVMPSNLKVHIQLEIKRIQAAKEFHQLKRNLQDQIIWTDERLARAKEMINDFIGLKLFYIQVILLH